jgi:hypothetical protein
MSSPLDALQLSLSTSAGDEAATVDELAFAEKDEPIAFDESHEVHVGQASLERGELVAAALVRVRMLAPTSSLSSSAWRAGVGVALQTVSAVSWLSAGRARGAA